jgi:glycerol-3-phosphate dehydrogenase
MERDLRKLSDQSFDVAVVGGGIYGVSIAREAALRGLTVALVEKEDFGGATSANSHKIVHGRISVACGSRFASGRRFCGSLRIWFGRRRS